MFPTDFRAAHVLQFCAQTVKCEPPTSVRTQPMEGEPQRDCFLTVEKQVALLGGECVIGWAIWETPGVFMEAEFHAVWRTPEGELVDITPRPIPLPHIVFARDCHRKYNGLQVDNIRKPLVGDVDLLHLFALYRERFAIHNTAKRAHQYGENIRWTRIERVQLIRIADQIAQLEGLLMQRYLSPGRAN